MLGSRNKHTKKFSTFTLEAKVAVVLFVIVAVGGVVYGFRGVAFRLKQPFLAQLNYSGPAYLSVEEREVKEIEEQKKRDTDQDGVNDYDEINIFNTSPYLVDTDSDGIADAIEISEGTDPACPTGQNCASGLHSVDAVGQSPDLMNLVEEPPPFDFSQLGGIGDLRQQVNQKSTAELRKILIGTGLDADIVNNLGDDEIRNLFLQTIDDAEQSSVVDQVVEQNKNQIIPSTSEVK